MNTDNITLERIETMHPTLIDSLIQEYIEATALLPAGKMLRFAYCYRSIQEQNDLYARGRSKKYENGKRIGIVTNAQGGQSFHNFGLAFDIVMLIDKDNNGSFETADYKQDKDFKTVVAHFKARGWEWGGDFKSFKDAPHFQKTFGFRTKDLLNNCIKNKVKYPFL